MAEITQEGLKKLQRLAHEKKYNKLAFYKPYPKQELFHSLSATKRERLFNAGNQNGKTLAGAFEMAMHLTGRYPDWWTGRRWTRAIRAWAAGEGALLVRDTVQKLLCGEAGVDEAFGTGAIPRECLLDKSMGKGITDAYDSIQVRHISGGISILRFKSYDQGRQKFQGETLDLIWFDEEPDKEEIYYEALTRTTATKGIVYMTYTPMLGHTKIFARFHDEKSEDRVVVMMTIHEAEHFTPEEREALIKSWPKYQQKTRALGLPMAGEGAVFEVEEELIREPTLEYVPEHWFKIWGTDFGIGHPFAAALLLWDKDADVLHVHAGIRMVDEGQGSLPIHHAKAIKRIAGNVPVAWPQDGTAREKGTGKTVASLYRDENLRMLDVHAAWPDGSVSTEAGILEMQDRMTSHRFKVAAHLTQWFEEFRMYHRKDGQIIKINDDLLSATRVGIMAKRFAKQVELIAGERVKRRRPLEATDVEFSFDW